MTRQKSALITKVACNALCKEDFNKVKSLDLRYSDIITRDDDRSYHEIRLTQKPYVFELKAGGKYTVITNTRKIAEKAFKEAGHSMREVNSLTVEYANETIESLKLKTYSEARTCAQRKSKKQ